MFNRISLGKVASISIATTLSLAFSTSNAKALDFSFSGVSRNIVSGSGSVSGTDTLTANGTFSINDAVIPGDGSSAVLTVGDFAGWNINIVNSFDGSTTMLNQGNSGIAAPIFFPTGLEVTNSLLDFGTIDSGSFCITTDGTNCNTGQGYFFANNNNVRLADVNSITELTSPILTASVASATPVPFEVSPTLGLLMVGGIWGVNRFRKSKKSLVK